MKQYKVTITETLQMGVYVNADSLMEAEKKVENEWRNQRHILGAEHFRGVDFSAKVASTIKKIV